MNVKLRNLLAGIVICTLLTSTVTETAMAQPAAGFDDGFDFHIGRDIALVSVGLGATVGLGLYFARRGHHLTGCVGSDAGTLELTASGDRQIYALVGNMAAVNAGELVRVVGKRKRNDATGKRVFLVKSVQRTSAFVKHALPRIDATD